MIKHSAPTALALACALALQPVASSAEAQTAPVIPLGQSAAAGSDSLGATIALPDTAEPRLGPVQTDAARAIPLPLLGQTPAAGADTAGAAVVRPGIEAAALPLPEGDTMAPIWPLSPGHATDRRARFAGERAQMRFALYLPHGARPAALRLRTVSSAFVLPETSALTVAIEGQAIGEVPLTTIADFAETTLPLPNGLLKPGRNIVTISAVQQHRVVCGATASWDLWTDIDLSASGASFDAADARPGPERFLAAIAALRASGKPLALRTASDEASALSGEQVALANTLGTLLGGGGLRITTDAGAGAAGPQVTLRRGPAASARLEEVEGAPALRVTAGPGGLPDLSALFGVAPAADPIQPLPLDAAVPLSQLGFATRQIAQHHWRGGFSFALPETWLVNTSLPAELRLDYGHVPSLPEGARMNVFVNGQPVRIVPFSRAEGQVERALPVRFDGSLLRAGRNQITFETIIPSDPFNPSCTGTTPVMVEIGDSSTLTVGSVPAMIGPDLGRGLAHLSADGLANATASVFTAPPDGRLLTIAAALPALPAHAAEGDMTQRSTRLTVLGVNQLSAEHFGAFQIAPKDMLAALAPGAPRRLAPAPTADPDAPLLLGATRVTQIGLADRAMHVADRITAQIGRIGDLARADGAAGLRAWIAGRRGQAVMFTLNPEAPDMVYLVVGEHTDPAALAAAVSRATTTEPPMAAHAALLKADGTWELWRDTTRLPILADALTLSTFRVVLGNVAVTRPLPFIGFLLAIALVSALVALSYAHATRRPR